MFGWRAARFGMLDYSRESAVGSEGARVGWPAAQFGLRIPRSRCVQARSGARGWRGAGLGKSQRSMEQLHQDTTDAGRVLGRCRFESIERGSTNVDHILLQRAADQP